MCDIPVCKFTNATFYVILMMNKILFISKIVIFLLL